MKRPASMYEIQIREYLDSDWADWLGGMTLTHTEQGATLLRGVLPDQAALYGVLTCLRDLGLTLTSVRRVAPDAVSITTHDEETNMRHVRSKDGTPIAFDQLGDGPPVILVCGGSVDRMSNAPLAALLAQHFTVFNYDRRGRGDSGDTPRYAVAREVEDLDTVITVAGGSAGVYGTSSGAALALEAAASGLAITRLALWEPPFSPEGYPRPPANTAQVYTELVAAGRRGDAVEYFMAKVVGLPPEFVAQARTAPWWLAQEALAHTLAYDATIMGDYSIPAERVAAVTTPTLVIAGGTSFPFMRITAQALADLLPHGQTRILDGQEHNVAPEAIAPVLTEFFKAEYGTWPRTPNTP